MTEYDCHVLGIVRSNASDRPLGKRPAPTTLEVRELENDHRGVRRSNLPPGLRLRREIRH